MPPAKSSQEIVDQWIQGHGRYWNKFEILARLTEHFRAVSEPPRNATAVQAMRHRLQTREGEATYATRKSTVETVFGIIKYVLGFRQFLLRELESVQSEWSLVCIGWNLKRMHAMRGCKVDREGFAA